MDDPSKLTLDDLIAWGRDWQRYLEGSRPHGHGFDVPLAVLQQYITAANEALAQQREQERKKPRARIGRPRGGMGEQKARLMAADVREKDAERIAADTHNKPVESVRRADQRVRKKPPR